MAGVLGKGMFVARLSCALIGAAMLVFVAASSRADTIPTHGGGPHLDPFILGPVAAGAVGPAANGTTGEIILAGTASVPWSSPYTAPATDAINDPTAIWHWEMELDFLGINGVIPTSVNGSPFVPVTYGAGTDLRLDVHQMDLGGSGTTGIPGVVLGSPAAWGGCDILGSGETGSVCKNLVNHTGGSVAWGVSVTESPGALGTTVTPLHGPPTPWYASRDNHNTILVEQLPNGSLSIRSVPEPNTALLLGLGLVVLAATGRTGSGARTDVALHRAF